MLEITIKAQTCSMCTKDSHTLSTTKFIFTSIQFHVHSLLPHSLRDRFRELSCGAWDTPFAARFFIINGARPFFHCYISKKFSWTIFSLLKTNTLPIKGMESIFTKSMHASHLSLGSAVCRTFPRQMPWRENFPGHPFGRFPLTERMRENEWTFWMIWRDIFLFIKYIACEFTKCLTMIPFDMKICDQCTYNYFNEGCRRERTEISTNLEGCDSEKRICRRLKFHVRGVATWTL